LHQLRRFATVGMYLLALSTWRVFPKRFCTQWSLTLVDEFAGLKLKAPRLQTLQANSLSTPRSRDMFLLCKPKFCLEYRQLFARQCNLTVELLLTTDF